jgi:hypothetical protein
MKEVAVKQLPFSWTCLYSYEVEGIEELLMVKQQPSPIDQFAED